MSRPTFWGVVESMLLLLRIGFRNVMAASRMSTQALALRAAALLLLHHRDRHCHHHAAVDAYHPASSPPPRGSRRRRHHHRHRWAATTTTTTTTSSHRHARPVVVDHAAFARATEPSFALLATAGEEEGVASSSSPPQTSSSSSSSSFFFPSDDSDYRRRGSEGGAIEPPGPMAAVVPSRRRSWTARLEGGGGGGGRGGGTASVVVVVDDINPTIVDPIDLVADWVSMRLVERSIPPRPGPDAQAGESYPPGSILDILDRWASSTSSSYHDYSSSSSSSSVVVPSTHAPLSHQARTIVRVGLPSVIAAVLAWYVYPGSVRWLVRLGSPSDPLYTDGVITVLSNDLSQYVQNVLTTCALLFGILAGQAYYFTYKEQERVYYALFAEVTEAKSLLEQISLLSYGRRGSLYPTLLSRMDDYVRDDLGSLSVRDPVDVIGASSTTDDDPLESILYATSVGAPGPIYDTVRSLRRARSERCGALQSKLPDVHVHVLRLLGFIVLATFPVCGSGSSAIAPNVLALQSYMFGMLAFGLTAVLGVVEELRNSTRRSGGAYGVDGALGVMVSGLVEELDGRMGGEFGGGAALGVAGPGPPPPAVAALARGGGSVAAGGRSVVGGGGVDGEERAVRREGGDAVGGHALLVVDDESNALLGDGTAGSDYDAPGSNDNDDRGDEPHPSRRRGIKMWFRRKLSRGQ